MMQLSSNIGTVPTSQGNISIWDSQNSGHPVVFIHGNSACKETFSKQYERDIAQKYRFIAMDLPGHGNSDKAKDPDSTYSLTGYAGVVIEVINSLGLKNPVIVGGGLGGHIGISVLQKAQALAGLLITGTPPIKISEEGFKEGFRPSPIPEYLFTKIEFSEQEAVEFMRGQGFNTNDRFIVESALKTDGYARLNLINTLNKGVGGDQKEAVEVSDIPLCVVQGEDDVGINNEYIIKDVKYKNLFERKVTLVKDAGHAVYWEKPEEFHAILSIFLSHVCKN